MRRKIILITILSLIIIYGCNQPQHSQEKSSISSIEINGVKQKFYNRIVDGKEVVTTEYISKYDFDKSYYMFNTSTDDIWNIIGMPQEGIIDKLNKLKYTLGEKISTKEGFIQDFKKDMESLTLSFEYGLLSDIGFNVDKESAKQMVAYCGVKILNNDDGIQRGVDKKNNLVEIRTPSQGNEVLVRFKHIR